MNQDASRNGMMEQERRIRPDLRRIFEESIERLGPFFNSGLDSSDTPMEYWAARTLRDMHPELSTQDIRMLVNAAYRYYRDKRSRAQYGQDAAQPSEAQQEAATPA